MQAFPGLIAAALIVTLILCGMSCEVIDAGEVGVVTVMGSVNQEHLDPGFHMVNPFGSVDEYNTKDQALTAEDIAIIPQDDLRSLADITINYRVIAAKAPHIKGSTGTEEQLVEVLLRPRFRSAIRQAAKSLERTEMLSEDEGQRRLQVGIADLLKSLEGNGIEVTAVLMRDLRRPKVIEDSAQAKVERQQAAQRQEEELKRVKTEAQEKVVQAEADMRAAEMQAKQLELMADARAYEITTVAKAIEQNPTFLELETLRTFGAMATDPAAKFYFMDPSKSAPAIPFLNLGK